MNIEYSFLFLFFKSIKGIFFHPVFVICIEIRLTGFALYGPHSRESASYQKFFHTQNSNQRIHFNETKSEGEKSQKKNQNKSLWNLEFCKIWKHSHTLKYKEPLCTEKYTHSHTKMHTNSWLKNKFNKIGGIGKVCIIRYY